MLQSRAALTCVRIAQRQQAAVRPLEHGGDHLGERGSTDVRLGVLVCEQIVEREYFRRGDHRAALLRGRCVRGERRWVGQRDLTLLFVDAQVVLLRALARRAVVNAKHHFYLRRTR